MTTKNSRVMELKAMLMEALSGRLSAIGFMPQPREQRFTRETSGAIQIIHMSFKDDRAHQQVSVSANLAVRHVELEELATAHRDDLSRKDKARTATIGWDLGLATGSGQTRWRVASGRDVTTVSDAILLLLQKGGFEYLEKFSDLRQIVKQLASNNPDDWHQSMAGSRAVRLPLALALLGEHQAAQECFREQHEFLKSLQDPGLRYYPLLVQNACQTFKIQNPLETHHA